MAIMEGAVYDKQKSETLQYFYHGENIYCFDVMIDDTFYLTKNGNIISHHHTYSNAVEKWQNLVRELKIQIKQNQYGKKDIE